MSILKLLPRFRGIEQQLERFAAREQWSSNQIAEYQLERINQLWAHARVHVPFYRELAEQRDLPPTFATLTEYSSLMPIVPKSVVRDLSSKFLSEARAPGHWKRTGGSTGAPTAIYWEHLAHLNVLRAKYRNEQSHGLDIFDKKVFLWGHSGSYAPGLKGKLQKSIRPVEDWLRNRMRVPAYDLSDNCLRERLTEIKRFGPKSLYGYSSAIDLLAKVADENSFEIPTLDVAILTAEPADTRMCRQVGQRLNCKAVAEYGATECPFIAGQTVADGEFCIRDDVVYLEANAHENGYYDLILTVLGNPSFPVMRYAIEDTTSSQIIRPERGFAVLQDVQGRKNDILISKSGRRLHSMAIKHTLEHWKIVRRFTVIQKCDGSLDITLETRARLPDSDRHSLRSQFVKMLDGYPVSIREVDEIPGNLAGKHRWIICEMDAHHKEEGEA